MLERFLKLKSAIQKALIDIKSSYQVSADEFSLLSETVATLTPIKYALEAFCRQDANLLIADATLKFLIYTLGKINCVFANEMKNALEFRIKERRTDLSSLLQYLHSVYANSSSSFTDLFPALKKIIIKRLLLNMVQRLFISESDNENDELRQQHSDKNVSIEVSIVEQTENDADTIK